MQLARRLLCQLRQDEKNAFAVSDLGLMTTPLPDAATLAAGLLRPAVPGPASQAGNPVQPAGTPASTGSAADSGGPFAALLLGFLQGAQPALVTPTTAGATAATAAGDELQLPDLAAASSGMPATLPVATAGMQPATAEIPLPANGRALPAGGSSLPLALATPADNPELAALPAGDQAAGSLVTATRISLADIEHSRQPDAAPAVLAQADAWNRRFMPLAASSTTNLATPAATGDTATELLPGTEPGSALQQPAGLTAGDLSRLVQNLAQNGGRESFAAAFRTDGNSMNSPPGATVTGSPQTADTSAGGMLRGALGGFPPLQPLGPAQAWTTGLGDRLLTLAGPGTHSARLRLHPESLGTLDIEIKVADNTAQVWFGAQHSQTREAIEASLPQLREMFAEQGIRLAHAQVDSGADQHARQQPQTFSDTGDPADAWRKPAARASLPEPLPPVVASTSRLVDAWA
jgi:flagellar hook-length control protein FliK